MNRDKILDKIQKLFSLSKSNNENEASSALTKAKALMDQYGVSQSDLIESSIKEQTGVGHKAQIIQTHLAFLVETIADLFQCKTYWQTKWIVKSNSYETYPVFVGFDPHVSIAKYTYDNLARKLTKSRSEFLKGYGKSKKVTDCKNGYAVGWVRGVRDNILHLIPEEITVDVESGTGLIAVNPISAYLQKKQFDDSVSKTTSYSDKTMAHGYSDGKEVVIDKGIDHQGKEFKQIGV